MKIVMVLPSGYAGGGELSCVETIKGLAGRKHKVYAVLPVDGPLRKMIQDFCEEVVVLEFSWWVAISQWPILFKVKMLRGYLQSAIQLRDFFKRWNADIVVTNTIAIPSGALAGILSGVPHVWYIHELGQEDQKFIFEYGFKTSVRFMKRSSVRFIVNSKNVFNKYSRYFASDRIDIIKYAVELDTNAHTGGKKYDVIFLGRVTADKNQEELIRAMHILKQSGTVINALIVGRREEAYYQELRSIAVDLGVDGQITFSEFVNNPASLIAGSKMLVVCSRNEAFGRVIIEGMKVGVPVIVPNSGSGPEIVTHGENGLVYELGNPASLAESILRYLSTPMESERISANGKAWALANFNLDSHTVAIEKSLLHAIDQYRNPK